MSLPHYFAASLLASTGLITLAITIAFLARLPHTPTQPVTYPHPKCI
ncbi:MAG: hypothetical protein NTU53_03155 [Planctomycetota bacterium]|nr:hypothetical protein [Planctomycetota bacterium]